MKIFSICNNMNIFIIWMYIMVPAHFHDVDGELSDSNVGKMFGFSKILTAILKHWAFVVIWSALLVVCFYISCWTRYTFTDCYEL